MKKIVVSVLVVIVLVCLYVIATNISAFKGLKSFQVTQSNNSVIPTSVSWEIYTDTKNGLRFMYPVGLVAEENTEGGYPEKIEFKPTTIKMGSFFGWTIYDIKKAKSYGTSITDIKSVPQTSYNSNTSVITDNITVGSIPMELTKQGQERATVSFIYKQNAYRLDWDCWPQQACFNDEILNKLVNSISFTK